MHASANLQKDATTLSAFMQRFHAAVMQRCHGRCHAALSCKRRHAALSCSAALRAWRRHYASAAITLHPADLGASTQPGGDDLLSAADKGEVAEVQRLLRAGLDINFVDQHGSSALHKAARSGRVEVLVFMVTY
jgi:hypothetical protein